MIIRQIKVIGMEFDICETTRNRKACTNMWLYIWYLIQMSDLVNDKIKMFSQIISLQQVQQYHEDARWVPWLCVRA